jgi:hypothetical protein
MRRRIDLAVFVALVGSPSAALAEPDLELVLQLQDGDVAVEILPTPTVDARAVKNMEHRVMRAKAGLGASVGAFVIGGIFAGVAVPNLTCDEAAGGSGGDCPNSNWALPVFVTGLTLAGGGVLGMIASGALLGVRKHRLRRLQQGLPARRRVQWDVARSRLVF